MGTTRGVSRRGFLVGSGLVVGGAAAWSAGLVPARVVDAALADVWHNSAWPEGTTLAATISRPAGPGYVRLGTGPGWPTIIRTELASGLVDATASRRRRDRRRPRALAAIAHLTDIHTIDAQSPGRVEFLDALGPPFEAAFRPQETLTMHVATSMVRRINRLGRGPVTGRPLDCAVSTGDNIDNQQRNEMEWFIRVLDGGVMRADSGARGRYDGVQAIPGDTRYWHPEAGTADSYKTGFGFPEIPGLLDAALRPFRTPGLRIPWYSTYGNHDGLVQGNLPAQAAIDEILGGSAKITALGSVGVAEFLLRIFADQQWVLDRMRSGGFTTVDVAPDQRRRTVSPRDWVQAHLDSPRAPGPKGHGYTEEHLELPALYYEFDIADGVLGISLDTGGHNSGSIGERQLQWLESVLQREHSLYYDAAGRAARTSHEDRVVMVFSHFTIGTMNQPMVDPNAPDDRRVLGDEVAALLHRYPNVVAWVNGHTHINSVRPVPDPLGHGGFWEINTASHVDYPEHARIVELVDNRDGTLSLVCTMLEHLARPQAAYDRLDPLGLASISRELAANDPQSNALVRLGALQDLNVECVIRAPFDVAAAGLRGVAG